MINVVFLHAISYFLNNQTVFHLWDYIRFEVPIFIFCSAYLSFNKELFSEKPLAPFTTASFIKRIKRLYLPYLIFLGIYFALVWLFEPQRLTVEYVWLNLSLWGGVDINWLVVLFIQFAVLFPFLSYWFRTNKIWFWSYAALAISSTIYLFFFSFPYHWKYIMWLPWSVMGLVTIFFLLYRDKPLRIAALGVIAAGIATLAFALQYLRDGSITLYDNKYPPDMLFLSYGITGLCLLYWVAQHRWLSEGPLLHGLTFMSTNSYSIYFIHYLVLYVCSQFEVHKQLSWYLYFIVIFGATIAIQLATSWFLRQLKLSS
jgi:peptidoglycan/LPS O-acetylase OafA/YrhL